MQSYVKFRVWPIDSDLKRLPESKNCHSRTETETKSPVPAAIAGDIVVLPKLPNARTGDTFAAPDFPVVYDPIRFPNPLHTVALVPEKKGEEEKLMNALLKVSEEDPTCQVEKSTEGKQLLHVLPVCEPQSDPHRVVPGRQVFRLRVVGGDGLSRFQPDLQCPEDALFVRRVEPLRRLRVRLPSKACRRHCSAT